MQESGCLLNCALRSRPACAADDRLLALGAKLCQNLANAVHLEVMQALSISRQCLHEAASLCLGAELCAFQFVEGFNVFLICDSLRILGGIVPVTEGADR